MQVPHQIPSGPIRSRKVPSDPVKSLSSPVRFSQVSSDPVRSLSGPIRSHQVPSGPIRSYQVQKIIFFSSLPGLWLLHSSWPLFWHGPWSLGRSSLYFLNPMAYSPSSATDQDTCLRQWLSTQQHIWVTCPSDWLNCGKGDDSGHIKADLRTSTVGLAVGKSVPTPKGNRDLITKEQGAGQRM